VPKLLAEINDTWTEFMWTPLRAKEHNVYLDHLFVFVLINCLDCFLFRGYSHLITYKSTCDLQNSWRILFHIWVYHMSDSRHRQTYKYEINTLLKSFWVLLNSLLLWIKLPDPKATALQCLLVLSVDSILSSGLAIYLIVRYLFYMLRSSLQIASGAVTNRTRVDYWRLLLCVELACCQSAPSLCTPKNFCSKKAVKP